MKKILFYKYQGTGNDFICIDNRQREHSLTKGTIKKLCNRRYGIGADGLILLQNEEGYDFRMVYYNADGGESTMCGNGGRCITLFARDCGIVKDHYSFLAADGPHESVIDRDRVNLRMKDVNQVEKMPDGWYVDTGSPHYMSYVMDLEQIDLVKEAWNIRYSDAYREDGVNVNFLCLHDDKDGLVMRTYERGVEAETLSCGTGVTAAAIVSYEAGKIRKDHIDVHTPGGDLEVSFSPQKEGGYKNVWLKGPAAYVFKGSFEIDDGV